MKQVQQRVLKAQVSSTPCLALFWARGHRVGSAKGLQITNDSSFCGVPGEAGVVTVWWEGL